MSIVNTECKQLYLIINNTLYWCRYLTTDSVDDVVDLEDGPDALGGQGDGAGGDEQRLDHVLLQDVGDASFPHVDPSRLLSLDKQMVKLSQVQEFICDKN